MLSRTLVIRTAKVLRSRRFDPVPQATAIAPTTYNINLIFARRLVRTKSRKKSRVRIAPLVTKPIPRYNLNIFKGLQLFKRTKRIKRKKLQAPVYLTKPIPPYNLNIFKRLQIYKRFKRAKKRKLQLTFSTVTKPIPPYNLNIFRGMQLFRRFKKPKRRKFVAQPLVTKKIPPYNLNIFRGLQLYKRFKKIKRKLRARIYNPSLSPVIQTFNINLLRGLKRKLLAKYKKVRARKFGFKVQLQDNPVPPVGGIINWVASAAKSAMRRGGK